jgi:hypothetical protein
MHKGPSPVPSMNRLSTLLRYLLFACGILISLPLIILLFFLPRTPVSPIGVIYLLSYALVILGMVFAPRRSNVSSTFLMSGTAIVLITLAVRLLFPPSGERVSLMTLPGASGPRLLNRILDEQDVVLFGAQAAPYLGAISPTEKNSLDLKFFQTFQEMNTQGVTPLSPFLATYLFQQRPGVFDVVIAEPRTRRAPKAGIIFLHGFGGNFTLQCWLMAKAGDRIDAVTVCPSTDPSGYWWNSQGQSILHETLTYLQQRGVKRIYLAGLSNGAIGASRLANQFQGDLAGLILISGADPAAAMTDLSVLLLHGKNDERIPVSVMERYASAAGAKDSYHRFDGDHFVLLKQADEVQAVIVDWLRQQEADVEDK